MERGELSYTIIPHGWVNLCILQNTCGIIQGGLNSFEIKMIKKLQIIEGALFVL